MSLTNAEIKDIQTLRSKKGRRDRKQFIAEGVRLLEEALRHDFLPTIVCCSAKTLSDRGRDLVEQFRKRQVNVADIPMQKLDSMSETRTSPGILACFRTPSTSLAELYRPEYRKLLLCENINDPGNLGTLFRSALAFGFDLIVAVGECAEAYSPKVVRSSAGAIFGARIAVSDAQEIRKLLDTGQPRVVAALPTGDDKMHMMKQLSQSNQIVLAIGSETEGLSDWLVERAAARVRISHRDTVESLNAAVAGSILMNELYEG